MSETPTFAPSEEFAAQANATAALYDEAKEKGTEFWAEQARELLTWSKPFAETLDWSNSPFAKWFKDGELNACYNAVDRHVENGLGDRVAIHFEGEPGDTNLHLRTAQRRGITRS